MCFDRNKLKCRKKNSNFNYNEASNQFVNEQTLKTLEQENHDDYAPVNYQLVLDPFHLQRHHLFDLDQ